MDNQPDHYQALFNTTDGRTAEISLQPRNTGVFDIEYKVLPSGGVLTKGMYFRATEGESYFGLLERVVDGEQKLSWSPRRTEALDLRGQKVEMLVKPTLGIYSPFYVSSQSYGVFVKGTYPGFYDMAATDKRQVSLEFEGESLNISLIPGESPQNVVENYVQQTGLPLLPPEWAFLPFHWRGEHTQEYRFFDGTPNRSPYNVQVVEDILLLEAFDIPIGVYWIDRPWAQGEMGYTDFEWDRKRFPNPEKMIQWLKSKNIRFMLWIAPWVHQGKMLEEAQANNFLIPEAKRITSGEDEEEQDFYQLIDFTNPEAKQWWEGYLKKVIRQGVAGFKMDRSEEILPENQDIRVADGRTVRQMRNEYPKIYLKAAYDIMQKYRQDDFLLMPRAAYTGSTQYGVFWGGDIQTGEYGLRAALIALQRSAFMGFPFWGSDIGGYWGGPLEHQVVARWLEFGSFCPIMEVGPLNDRAVWNMPYSPSYDQELIAIYRTYATLHQRLANYSYQQAKLAASKGTPFVKPMTMAFPNDPEAKKHWDQYLYGNDILVGIIWQKNKTKFEIYLPKGQWKDAWSGKIYQGNKTLSIDCPLHKIPIFLKKESDIQLGDINALYEESLELAAEKPNLERLQYNEFARR